MESLGCKCPVLQSDQVSAGGDLSQLSSVSVAKREVDYWCEEIKNLLSLSSRCIFEPFKEISRQKNIAC